MKYFARPYGCNSVRTYDVGLRRERDGKQRPCHGLCKPHERYERLLHIEERVHRWMTIDQLCRTPRIWVAGQKHMQDNCAGIRTGEEGLACHERPVFHQDSIGSKTLTVGLPVCFKHRRKDV